MNAECPPPKPFAEEVLDRLRALKVGSYKMAVENHKPLDVINMAEGATIISLDGIIIYIIPQVTEI